MKTKILAALIAAGAASHAFAFDGTITFNGAITATPCVINGGTPDFAVTLPTVQHTAVDNNQVAGRTPFRIVLTQCPALAGAHAYFEPINSNVDAATGYLKNTVAGGASNVEISLRNSDESWIDLRGDDFTQNSRSVPITSGSATLNYFAEYQGINGAVVTAGLVESSVVYSISYQ